MNPAELDPRDWVPQSDGPITPFAAIIYNYEPLPPKLRRMNGRRGLKMRAAWNRRNGPILLLEWTQPS